MNVVVGFDTRFEAWRECDSCSNQPAAPVRWPWTDGSGVKYSPGVPSFGGAPRHVMATCFCTVSAEQPIRASRDVIA